MSNALLGLLSTLLATNQPAAISNLIAQNTGVSVYVPDAKDPVTVEFRQLMAEDDAAQAEVDEWIRAAQKQQRAGDQTASISLRARMDQRFDVVRKAYEDFIQRHPKHAGARLAYGSFLNDLAEEQAASAQFKKAVELDPKNPAGWNNLANYYGHNGPIEKAFDCYGKALALKPLEPVYYQNLATTMYLFRRDATNYFKISLDEVFAKSLALYRRALDLDPTNFLLATDLAMTYYGIPVPKTGDKAKDARAMERQADAALASWQTALKLARTDKERQGVHIHFARWQINANRFEAARKSLDHAKNPVFDRVRATLRKKLEKREKELRSPSPTPTPTTPPTQ